MRLRVRELGGSLVSLGCNYCLFLKTKYVVSKISGSMSVGQKLGQKIANQDIKELKGSVLRSLFMAKNS